MPFSVTSIPERLSPVYVADKRVNTATTGGTIGAAAVRLNRVTGASFNFATPVMEVIEMGSQFRVGGVDDLGEATFKLDFNDVGINNMAAVTGTVVNTSSGSTTNIGLTQFQSAQIDIFRFVADPQNNIFGTLYLQDCIMEEYSVEAREKGVVTETVSGKGPNALFFPGFVVPKVYIVSATDVTNGYIDLSSFIGADEQPVQLYNPTSGNAPTYWQQNGSLYFLKVEQIKGAVLTNNPTRFYETTNAYTPPAASTVTYTPATKHLAFPASTLTNGDMIRLVFLTYNNDTFPLTVPTTSPDTTDRPGIPSRIIPVNINSNQVHRVQSCSIRFSFRREHVQGVGENQIIYGVPSVPDVAITLDSKEYDNTVLAMLSTGSPNFTSAGGTIASDLQDLNYITRKELATAYPLSITLDDPFNVGTVLASYTSPQVVVKGVDFASTDRADNTLRFTAIDIIGNFVISFTHP